MIDSAATHALNSAGLDRPGLVAADPVLVPLAPRTDSADAERERAQEYLRRKLAEGRLSPSRARLMREELERWERAA